MSHPYICLHMHIHTCREAEHVPKVTPARARDMNVIGPLDCAFCLACCCPPVPASAPAPSAVALLAPLTGADADTCPGASGGLLLLCIRRGTYLSAPLRCETNLKNLCIVLIIYEVYWSSQIICHQIRSEVSLDVSKHARRSLKLHNIPTVLNVSKHARRSLKLHNIPTVHPTGNRIA